MGIDERKLLVLVKDFENIDVSLKNMFRVFNFRKKVSLKNFKLNSYVSLFEFDDVEHMVIFFRKLSDSSSKIKNVRCYFPEDFDKILNELKELKYVILN
ncbi:MAG: hypothetical protein PF569_09460 [Candidatus Woesearchaeota archaeon]|jgi:hypothetical protein|nr:hypothetical protein [Candidatus Woesearchaeota archaeon]